MATATLPMGLANPASRRLIMRIGGLLGIFILSGLFLALNYWAGITFFFLSLLIFIRFGLEEYEARGLWLLIVFSLAVFVFVGSLALLFLANNPEARQPIETSAVANTFLGRDGAILLTIGLVGIAAALVGVIVPFLFLIAAATVGILKWHKRDKNISFWQAYRYLLTSVLGIFRLSIIIDNGEIKGGERDKEQLENFGGPGWLIVYPGQVVVLHEAGKITRVIGLGSTMLKRGEQLKAVVPLTGKGGSNPIENVLTRDRIPLTITVAHGVQVEPVAETRKRLQRMVDEARTKLQDDRTAGKSAQELEEAEKQLKEAEKRLLDTKGDKVDKPVGDDYDQCYESIARLVATKIGIEANVANIADTMKGSVASNIRDVIMSCNFEELFNIGDNNSDLGVNINNRKITAIEKIVLEKAGASGPGKGVILRGVDISEIHFPEKIKEKILTEATELAEERIKNIQARTQEATAEFEARVMLRREDADSTAKLTRARAEQMAAEAGVRTARAEAEAEFWQGRGKATAKAEYFQRITQVLRDQNQSEETIRAVLQNLASSTALEEELKRLLELTVHYIRGEHTRRGLSEQSQDH